MTETEKSIAFMEGIIAELREAGKMFPNLHYYGRRDSYSSVHNGDMLQDRMLSENSQHKRMIDRDHIRYANYISVCGYRQVNGYPMGSVLACVWHSEFKYADFQLIPVMWWTDFLSDFTHYRADFDATVAMLPPVLRFAVYRAVIVYQHEINAKKLAEIKKLEDELKKLKEKS